MDESLAETSSEYRVLGCSHLQGGELPLLIFTKAFYENQLDIWNLKLRVFHILLLFVLSFVIRKIPKHM